MTDIMRIAYTILALHTMCKVNTEQQVHAYFKLWEMYTKSLFTNSDIAQHLRCLKLCMLDRNIKPLTCETMLCLYHFLKMFASGEHIHYKPLNEGQHNDKIIMLLCKRGDFMQCRCHSVCLFHSLSPTHAAADAHAGHSIIKPCGQQVSKMFLPPWKTLPTREIYANSNGS